MIFIINFIVYGNGYVKNDLFSTFLILIAHNRLINYIKINEKCFFIYN